MILMTMINGYCHIPFTEEEIDAQSHSFGKWQHSDSKAHLFGSTYDAHRIPPTHIYEVTS